MTTYIGIDPGPTHTGYCQLADGAIGEHGWFRNDLVLSMFSGLSGTVLLESPQAQDRPLGPALRNTIFWAGRFYEAMRGAGITVIEIEERDCARWLVGSSSPDNPAIKRALEERFGAKTQNPCTACEATGCVPGKKGPKKCPTCNGRKFKTIPGPLANMNEHELSALACCVVHQDREEWRKRQEVLGATA